MERETAVRRFVQLELDLNDGISVLHQSESFTQILLHSLWKVTLQENNE
jgi:hypothetical protein